MRSLILLFCFMFGFVALSNQVSFGDFSYDIDRFTVVGGVSGSATFVDEFDDDLEPPSGPSGPSTYSVPFGSFSTNAESGGVLNMNSNDAVILGDEIAIGVSLLDNTYQFIPGSGGFVEVKFSFPGGITTNSFFDLDISSQPWELNNPNEAVELSIAMDTPGVISAFFVAYVDDGLNEVDIDISEIDITNSLNMVTDVTLRLDISTGNVVTASLDIGSDGTFDLTMPDSYTLTFPGGKPYKGGFGPGMDIATFSYDIDRFTVVGGVSGSATFVDEFDDGEEPPSGPSGPFTYEVNGATISSTAENNGFLNMNSNDAPVQIDLEKEVNVVLSDNDFSIYPGVGGRIEGKFRFENGITEESAFGIELEEGGWGCYS